MTALTRTFIRHATAVALLTASAGLAVAPPVTAAPRRTNADAVIVVSHPAITPLLVQGAGVGAVRSFYTPIVIHGGRKGTYYMTGTLTTTAQIDGGTREVRVANLVFVLGSAFNQLVVGGIAYYPADGSTLAVGDTAVRPIIGGSGRFARAHGWVVSTNRGDAGWTHEFHFRRN